MKSSPAQLASSKKYYESHREENRAYRVSYYQNHRDEVLARVAAYDAAHREERRREYADFREWVSILRTVNGCVDCGTHVGWLEHHHVDPSTKRYQIAGMLGFSLDTLEEELEKCVVLCHSCHVTRHYALKKERVEEK